MGVFVGFVLGYVLGTRAGERGLEEMREALLTIGSSADVKELLGGGISLLTDLVRQGQESGGRVPIRTRLRVA